MYLLSISITKHMEIALQGEREKAARASTTCPACGEAKEAGEHSQIVCWGDCWRGEKGLKYTQLDTEEWLIINSKK